MFDVLGRDGLAVELHAKLLGPVDLAHTSNGWTVAENAVVDVSLVDRFVSARRCILPVGVLSEVATAIRLEAAVVGKILACAEVVFASGHILASEADGIGILVGALLLEVAFAGVRSELGVGVLELADLLLIVVLREV